MVIGRGFFFLAFFMEGVEFRGWGGFMVGRNGSMYLWGDLGVCNCGKLP